MNYFVLPGLGKFKLDKKKVRFISAERIISCVCEHFGFSKEMLFSKSQREDVVYPRQVAMYIIRKYSNLSLRQISERLTYQNHTSPIHSQKKIGGRMKVDERVRNEVNEIIENL